MLEAFYLSKNSAAIDHHWARKVALSQDILGKSPLRCLRPSLLNGRTRLDLMFQDRKLGIRGPSMADGNFDFFEIQQPDSVSAGINEMLDVFLTSRCPLKRAQLRFRESADGHQGLWIDTSNEEIKALLDEKTWISKMLLKGWVIEAGQKHKEFIETPEGALKFQAASARPWLASFSVSNDEIPLLSYAGLFSQPGPEANRALIAAGFELLDVLDLKEVPWIEWGAGYGNLSAAFTSRLGEEGFASEMDGGAFECLKLNQSLFFPNLKIAQLAAEKTPPPEAQSAKLWILDPPRSGFAELLETLVNNSQRPEAVLCYHCHEKGLSADSAKLKEAGYQLIEWSSVDAFPATPHHEVISIWAS